jgi:hypothetical protein
MAKRVRTAEIYALAYETKEYLAEELFARNSQLLKNGSENFVDSFAITLKGVSVVRKH